MMFSRGFTQYSREDYIQWKKEGRLVNCGVHAQVTMQTADIGNNCFMCVGGLRVYLWLSVMFQQSKALVVCYCLMPDLQSFSTGC